MLKKKLVHLDAVLDSGSLRVSVFGLCSCSQPGLGRGMYTCPSGQGLEETGIAFLGALLTRIPLSPLAYWLLWGTFFIPIFQYLVITSFYGSPNTNLVSSCPDSCCCLQWG